MTEPDTDGSSPPGAPQAPLTPRGEDPDERRLAALYGLGDPPPAEGGGSNPFWWVWAFVIPFILLALGLMTWRMLTSPQRVLPGM